MVTSSSRLSTDIVVVGAGPAGCMVAKTAAELGVNVLLLEEHPVPGLPVFCGEAISEKTLTNAGLCPDPSIIAQSIIKSHIYTPNGKHVAIENDHNRGYIINRHMFDAQLAENAVTAGAKLMVNTRAVDVIKRGGVIAGVEAECHGESFPIWAKIVIGADGHSSMVRRSALGIPYFKSFGVCAQYTLAGLNIEPDTIEIWIGRKYAPGGYAWVFPKSNSVANVGVGVLAKHATKPSIQYLQDFINQDPKLSEGTIINKTGGICPTTGTLDKIVGNGVMLVGDAAGQIIPMTGAGVETSIDAGKIAGAVAVKAIQKGNTSKARLEEYPEIFNKRWGKIIDGSKKTLNLFDNLSDEDLNKISEVITPTQVQNLANGEKVIRSLVPLIFKAPQLALKLVLNANILYTP